MEIKVLDILKTRDQEFLKKFCQEGSYIGEGGKIFKGVCRPVSAEEVLQHMHAYDSLLLDVVKGEEDYEKRNDSENR